MYMQDLSHVLAVLQAGGKGTRMRELTQDRIPKPMLQLGGRPMLEWQMVNLKKYGIREFVIIVGFLGEQIKTYFGDGSQLGVHIRYIEEREPLGSGGALHFLHDMLGDASHILLTLGDVMFDIDVPRFVSFHERAGATVTLLVHPNAHPQDSDLVVLEDVPTPIDAPVLQSAGSRVLRFDSKKNVRGDTYENCVNAGLYLLEPEVIASLRESGPRDLEREILRPYLEAGRMYGYRTTEYVKDAGTPERFARAEAELAVGIWAAKNLTRPQRAIFFDRDGTLNYYRGLIADPAAIELLPGAAEAVRRVNDAGWLAFVVTNQPVVARGMCTIATVQDMHRRLGVLLGRAGAYLDDIAFCPHHPDKGYPEENPAYKIPCHCRKPDTGMVEVLAKRWHIDLSQSWFIGDSARDIACGRKAGMRTALVMTGENTVGGTIEPRPDIVVVNALAGIQHIFAER